MSHLKNSITYLIPAAFSALIPILTLPIFTRILTPEDFGILALVQIYGIFAAGIADAGLTSVYMRNYFQYVEDGRDAALLYSSLLFVLSALALLMIVTYLFGGHLSAFIFGTPEHSFLMLFSLCSAGIITLKSYYLNCFKITSNAKAYTKYSIADALLSAIFSIYFVAILEVGVIGLILGPLLSGCIVFMVLSVRFILRYPLTLSGTVLFESLKISYPLTLKVVISLLTNHFDKYMIGLLATVGGVGIYSIGQRIANVPFVFMTALQNQFQPQVYKMMFEGETGYGVGIGRYLTPYLYTSIAVALLVALFSEEILVILVPETFYGAIDIVTVLAMFYGLMFFGKQPQLIFANKTHLITILTFISAIINIGLNIPFILKWGAIGAAWATFISAMLSGVLIFAVSQYYYKIDWEYKIVSSIYISFFSSVLLIILLREQNVDYIVRLGCKIGMISLYCYIGIKINFISKNNIQMLINLVRKGRA